MVASSGGGHIACKQPAQPLERLPLEGKNGGTVMGGVVVGFEPGQQVQGAWAVMFSKRPESANRQVGATGGANKRRGGCRGHKCSLHAGRLSITWPPNMRSSPRGAFSRLPPPPRQPVAYSPPETCSSILVEELCARAAFLALGQHLNFAAVWHVGGGLCGWMPGMATSSWAR